MTFIKKLQTKHGIAAANSGKLYAAIRNAIEAEYPELMVNDHLEELMDGLCEAVEEAYAQGTGDA